MLYREFNNKLESVHVHELKQTDKKGNNLQLKNVKHIVARLKRVVDFESIPNYRNSAKLIKDIQQNGWLCAITYKKKTTGDIKTTVCTIVSQDWGQIIIEDFELKNGLTTHTNGKREPFVYGIYADNISSICLDNTEYFVTYKSGMKHD